MKAESVELNDLEMYYETEGAGEPLLLLHGGTGCHQDWVYAGREQFVREYTVIAPDARGHGRTSNPQTTITHRQCAVDALTLLDHLGIGKCRAIGLSMGGNILLHIAMLQPERIQAMVVVSATMYFPEQARAVMRQVPLADKQPMHEWKECARVTRAATSKSQNCGTGRATCRQLRRYEFHSTVAVKNHRVHTDCLWRSRSALSGRNGIAMHRAIPRSSLWVVPNGSHGPVFGDAAPQFARTALEFFRTAH